MERRRLLETIAARICELTGTERCGLYLRDADTGLFKEQASYGSSRRLEGPGGGGARGLVAGLEADRLTQEIVSTRRPVIVRNAMRDPRPIRSAMRSFSVLSLLGVPMIANDTVIGLIFLDDAHQARSFDDGEVEVAAAFADMAAVVISQAETAVELRESLRVAVRKNEGLSRTRAIEDRLTDLAVGGTSLAEIAKVTADLITKDIEVYGQAGNLLARAAPEGTEGTVSRPLVSRSVREDEAVRAATAARAGRGGLIGPLPGMPYRCIAMPIMGPAGAVGSLFAIERVAGFDAHDLHIVRRAAATASLALAAERRAARAEWDERATLVGELIRGAADPVALRLRAELIGFNVEEPHVVCLVGGDEAKGWKPPDLAAVGTALEDGHGPVLAANVGEGLLLILASDPDLPGPEALAEVKRRVASLLMSIVPGGPPRAGISTACRRVGAYPDAYLEAIETLRCIRDLSVDGESRILAADDLGVARLLLASTTPERADRFLEGSLGNLVVHDAEYGSELLRTVHVFLGQRNFRHTARVLGIHENTVRYRLNQVEELTGLEIGGRIEDQLTAQVALLILRLRRPDLRL